MNLNHFFWTSILFSISYFLLDKLVQLLLRSTKCKKIKYKSTIFFVWNFCYYCASTFFLIYYHRFFIEPEVDKEVGRYFPMYENLLFFLADEANLRNFENIFVVTATFNIFNILYHLLQSDYTEAITRLFFTSFTAFLFNLRFEHYFLVLNICIGFYSAVTNLIFLVSLHTKKSNSMLFNFYATIYFFYFSYVFLSLIPFKYLLPTLYMQNFNIWLNICCWSWYGLVVWNSPILQVINHETFHTSANAECLGEGSVAKCLLLKETKDIKHLKCLQKSVEELRQAEDRSQMVNGTENTSAKAFQTIKCIMTLKRKIRRIRENKRRLSESQNDEANTSSELPVE